MRSNDRSYRNSRRHLPRTQILDCIRRVAAGGQWLEPIVGRKTLEGVLRQQAANERVAAVLTPCEIEVARMVSAGLSNKEIADALFISEGTVKTHLRATFEKLGVSSRMKLSVCLETYADTSRRQIAQGARKGNARGATIRNYSRPSNCS
jgi:DNA-binding NarL/FixJ family response regulator